MNVIQFIYTYWFLIIVFLVVLSETTQFSITTKKDK